VFIGADVNPEAEISIQFDTSVIENRAAIRERDLAEVNAGIMSKEEYRAKYYGESIEAAKNNIAKMNNTSTEETTE
jgi:hypothetical protein